MEKKISITSSYKFENNKINLAIIGAGNFAKSMHLPNLLKLKNKYNIYSIMSKTPNNAKKIAEQYKCNYATTDYNEILNDSNVDMVMICTPHNLHAEMSIKALKAKKAVFVEKPMALNEEELQKVIDTIEKTKLPFMVGFNRRFSKYSREIKKHIEKRVNPLIINYRMNAGYIDLDHWIHKKSGGGRIIGEGCHIFDLFNYFTEAEVTSITVNSIDPETEDISYSDNLVTTIKYKDGSICSLTYTALGNNNFPKEYCEIYFDGKIITLNDFKEINSFGIKTKRTIDFKQDKGHLQELVKFNEEIYPIPIWQLEQATKISFAVNSQLKRN